MLDLSVFRHMAFDDCLNKVGRHCLGVSWCNRALGPYKRRDSENVRLLLADQEEEDLRCTHFTHSALSCYFCQLLIVPSSDHTVTAI